MNTRKRCSAEFREIAVRLVEGKMKDGKSQWAAMQSISGKLGCTPESLRRWVRKAERDSGKGSGPSSEERERMKQLERENRELKRANEILRTASAYFAQADLDRRQK